MEHSRYEYRYSRITTWAVQYLVLRDNAFKTPLPTYPMIDKKLLDILACPKCKGDIRLEGDRLICDTCKLAYPIKDDIPIMIIEEAEKLT